jgi:hypothetical protein
VQCQQLSEYIFPITVLSEDDDFDSEPEFTADDESADEDAEETEPQPASADAAVSPMRASFTLPLTLGVPKFNRYRLNIMKGTTLDSGIVYLRGKSFQAFSISGTALQRSFKAV